MPRKRRSLTEIQAELLAKKAKLAAQRRAAENKLDAQLAVIVNRQKAQDRKADTHVKIIMGGAVQAHARLHPDFLIQLRAVLARAVTGDRDKGLIEGWFARLGQDQETPSPIADVTT